MVAKGLYYCDNLGNNNWVEGKVQKDQSLYLKNVNKNDQNSTVFAFDSFNFFVELRHEKREKNHYSYKNEQQNRNFPTFITFDSFKFF